jgi:hypothetical protein
MKHKLSYSLLLSLVVLFSFNLAQAQNISIVGPDPAHDPLLPTTAYCYDVVADDMTGITAFTMAVDVSGAGFATGSITTMPGLAGVVVNVVGDQVQLGYVGAGGGAQEVLITICVTTTDVCGADVVFAEGFFGPAPSAFALGGCGSVYTFTGLTNTLYDGTPVCGTTPDVNLACGGTIVDKPIIAADPIGLPLTYNQIAGVGSTDPVTGLYDYTPAGSECDFTSTVEVEVTNPCGNTAVCSFDVIYDQAAPVLTVPAAQTEHWNQGTQFYAASATDDGCPVPSTLTYTIEGVAGGTPVNGIGIGGTTGEITFDPDCGDVGKTFTVTVRVTDGCEFDEDSFDISVTNDLPTIVCPADVDPWMSYWGPMSLPFTAGDASDPVVVTILGVTQDAISVPVPAGMSISGTYNFGWDPDWTQAGLWVITLQVDDGCAQAICDFSVVVIDKFHLDISDVSVLPGHNATVFVSINESEEIGGMDLLITYDPTIAFLSAEPMGDLLGWEYFTYRKSMQDNCGGGCPTGVIHIIAIANMPDGVTPAESIYTPSGNIISLTFATPESFNYLNQCFHLNWGFFDCTDNTISDRSGEILFVAEDTDLLSDPGCLEGFKSDWNPVPWVNYYPGQICIIPPADDRGDINLNGIANEIADAVMFSNYFIYGPSVLHDDTIPDYFDNRVLASDVNDDGTPLTIADLVYLIRILTGDAIPYGESGESKVAPFAHAADVSFELGNEMVVSAYSPVDVGGAAFIFRHTGEIGTPIATDATSDMTIRSSDKNGELRVLVFSMEHNTIVSGANDLFTVATNGNTVELVEVQFSDAEGSLLAVNTNKIAPPTAFALLQNYPNPFNAGTEIRFALPIASDWTVGIYNVAGQLVKEFKGANEAGMVSLHWDATTASGIYFYKLTAGDFTDTKKMVLMK